MARSPGISGTAVALSAGGALLVYAGLKGQQPLEALRGVLTGDVGPIPAGTPVTVPSDFGGGTIPQTGTPANPSVGRAVQVALAQVGKPYRMGATGPDRFDCSGLIVYAYRQAGINLPRYWSGAFLTSSQFRKISRNELAAGDVLWKPGHVALATSNSGLVEAYQTGKPVTARAIQSGRFVTYLRYTGGSKAPSYTFKPAG